MRCSDRRQFAVNLDQPDQKGCRFQGTAAVRSMGKLVQVVAYPRKLSQQIGRYSWGFPTLPQAQTSERGAHQFGKRDPLILSNLLPMSLLLRCGSYLDPHGRAF